MDQGKEIKQSGQTEQVEQMKRIGQMEQIEQIEQKDQKNYVYIVECRDGSLYTGWTNHLQERIQAHNQGKGAKYTKSRRPVKLVHVECFATKEEAMRREYAIKQLPRRKKQMLIAAALQEPDQHERRATAAWAPQSST